MEERACEAEKYLLKDRDRPLGVVARETSIQHIELARVDVYSRVRIADPAVRSQKSARTR